MDFKAFSRRFDYVAPSVEFVNVQEQYNVTEDLICNYEFSGYDPHSDDKIAIFKIGWSYMKDHVCFEKVSPIKSSSNSKNFSSVTFKSSKLPKDNTELYQFCYISNRNELYGASSTFRFVGVEKPIPAANHQVFQKQTLFKLPQGESSRSSENSATGEIEKLKEENLILREATKALISQKNATEKTHESEMSDLRLVTDNLKTSVKVQQEEIKALRSRVIEIGELYKRLQLENNELKKKYSELQVSVDELSKREDLELKLSDIPDFQLGDFKAIPPFPFPK